MIYLFKIFFVPKYKIEGIDIMSFQESWVFITGGNKVGEIAVIAGLLCIVLNIVSLKEKVKGKEEAGRKLDIITRIGFFLALGVWVFCFGHTLG